MAGVDTIELMPLEDAILIDRTQYGVLKPARQRIIAMLKIDAYAGQDKFRALKIQGVSVIVECPIQINQINPC